MYTIDQLRLIQQVAMIVGPIVFVASCYLYYWIFKKAAKDAVDRALEERGLNNEG